MRRLATASATLAALLISCGGLAALAQPDAAAAAVPARAVPAAGAVPAGVTDAARSTAALAYLLAAQSTTGTNAGSIDESIGETADFIIGAADSGFDPATLRGCSAVSGAAGSPTASASASPSASPSASASALDFLATASDKAATDASKTGKAILAVLAAHENPTSFRGRNLLARLNALYHSGSGKFGSGTTFEQAFGILATRASGRSVAAAATGALLALQDPDGSWSYGSVPAAAGGGDTNSTAMALIALDRAAVHSADTTALAYLKSQQLADGGFPYQNATTYGPPASDPDSDAVVIEAILAAGQDPASSAWSMGTKNALTHIRSMQGPDGGFKYPGMGESAFTTSQVPAALMRMPYGAATSFSAGRAVPGTLCKASTPTPTPTPGASATPTASATATATPSETTAVTPTPTASPAPTSTPKPTARPTRRPTPRPVIVPTIAPTSAATDSTPAAVSSPTAAPSEAPTAAATAVAAATPVDIAVAGASGGSSDAPGAGNGSSSPAPGAPSGSASGSGSGSDGGGLPAPLVYGLAVAAGLAAVLGAGWLYLNRPLGRP